VLPVISSPAHMHVLRNAYTARRDDGSGRTRGRLRVLCADNEARHCDVARDVDGARDLGVACDLGSARDLGVARDVGSTAHMDVLRNAHTT